MKKNKKMKKIKKMKKMKKLEKKKNRIGSQVTLTGSYVCSAYCACPKHCCSKWETLYAQSLKFVLSVHDHRMLCWSCALCCAHADKSKHAKLQQSKGGAVVLSCPVMQQCALLVTTAFCIGKLGAECVLLDAEISRCPHLLSFMGRSCLLKNAVLPQ